MGRVRPWHSSNQVAQRNVLYLVSQRRAIPVLGYSTSLMYAEPGLQIYVLVIFLLLYFFCLSHIRMCNSCVLLPSGTYQSMDYFAPAVSWQQANWIQNCFMAKNCMTYYIYPMIFNCSDYTPKGHQQSAAVALVVGQARCDDSSSLFSPKQEQHIHSLQQTSRKTAISLLSHQGARESCNLLDLI